MDKIMVIRLLFRIREEARAVSQPKMQDRPMVNRGSSRQIRI